MWIEVILTFYGFSLGTLCLIYFSINIIFLFLLGEILRTRKTEAIPLGSMSICIRRFATWAGLMNPYEIRYYYLL
jgi:hypothetical protein